ncbi:hypothetical protein N7463_005976 [Penicillium fimorum]|uniref:COP9 signalosome complex subunit 3 N-terminal helical repeats domain-containing protein n=1 Tax=Penicillium fimorum TaxID=1882269 RepID=A0A9W9XTH8_9EURO|nr:hypothetical protein N7463_005976 [Penicillium fimorum]
MTLLSDIISASAHLHSSDQLPSDEYDRQIRELVEYFRRLQSTKSLHSLANDKSVLDPLLGATLVKDAMLRLDPSCAVFTSNHLLLVRLCLQAKAYSCVLPVLNKQICHFPISLGRSSSEPSVLCANNGSSVSFMTEASGVSSKLSYREYLQYFLYGGMVYMALKEWRNALHFLGIVISTPSTSSVSMIMVEAYKKWVLVGLLKNGKLCSPPSITAPHAVKVYQSLAMPYIILAHAFERGDLKRLNAEIDAATGVWCADNNVGLVSQVVGAFFSQTVIKLGKTFAALTVADLSKQVFPSPVCAEGVGSAVSSLVVSRALDATLVQTKGNAESSMLRFSSIHSLPRLSHELDLQSQLRQEMRLMESLVINLGETNNNLGLSDEYVDGLNKGQVWSGSSEVNPIVGGGRLDLRWMKI